MLLNYFIVGGLVTLADVVLYNLFTGGRAVRMPRIGANVLSTTVGMVLGFTLHFLMVFHPRDQRLPARMIEYIAVVGCAVYGVQNWVIYLLGDAWRGPVRVVQRFARLLDGFTGGTQGGSDDFVDRMTGKAAAAAAGMVWNYVWFKYVVYA